MNKNQDEFISIMKCLLVCQLEHSDTRHTWYYYYIWYCYITQQTHDESLYYTSPSYQNIHIFTLPTRRPLGETHISVLLRLGFTFIVTPLRLTGQESWRKVREKSELSQDTGFVLGFRSHDGGSRGCGCCWELQSGELRGHLPSVLTPPVLGCWLKLNSQLCCMCVCAPA